MQLVLELPILVAALDASGLEVGEDDRAFRALKATAAAYRDSGAAAPSNVPGVQDARLLFRALGIDPTKRRPSSEALLQRALKGKPLPRINALVDVGNWCSLDFLLPLGIYDRTRIAGGITLRQGGAGESYEAISGKTLNLEGRYLLADDEGPFGSPITDSLRTAVTTATTEAALLVYAPEGYDPARLEAHAASMAARITEVCGGTVAIEVHRGS